MPEFDVKPASFEKNYDTEVWLNDMAHRLKPFIANRQQRIKLLQLIHREATLSELPVSLILAIIQTESSFNQYAVSKAGAQGLMQVMPFWKKVIGKPEDNLTDAATNLRYGHKILKRYLKKENGNLTRALARYNGSRGKVWYPNRVYKNWDKHWR